MTKSALGISLLSAALWASLATAPVNGQGGDNFEPGRAERFVEIWIDDPADDFLLTKVYEAYSQFDRVDELVEQLKRRADALGPLLDPGSLTRRERRRRVNLQLALARVLQKRDRADRMMPHVQRALALDADHPLALTLHAELLARSGQTETAAAAIERALQRERRPDLRVALLETLGELRLRAKDRTGAVAAFERILGENPDDYFAAVALAELYTRHDLLEEAVAVHRHIIEGPGKRDRSLALKSRFAAGQLLDRLQQPQRALSEFELIVAQTRRGHWLRDQAVNAIFELHVSRGWFSKLRQYLQARISSGGMGPPPARAPEPGSTSAEQRELVVLLVRALTLDGRYQQANQLLQAAIDKSPGDPDLRRALVKLRHQAPTFDAAAQREALRGLLDLLPGDRRARIDLALSLYAADEPSQAREAWAAFTTTSPAPQALLELGRRLAATPDSAHALDLFKAAADAADPGEWSYFRELGHALQAAGHHAEALAAWQRMAPAGSRDPRGLAELGRVLRDTERHAESVTAWRRALALRPDDATLNHELGLALSAAGEFGLAVMALNRAIELSRDDEARQRSRRELIALYHARGDLPQLIAEFETKLADDPEDIEVIAALADMHRENRDAAQAIRLLQRAQALAPRHVGVGRTLALLLATSSEDSKTALAQYHHMARIDRAQRQQHLMRAGGVQERAGDPDAALETWRAILAESPPDADLLVELALRFERLAGKEESRDAERALAQAVVVDPLRSEAWRALGRVRTSLGDQLAAFDAFLTAARTGRNEDEVRLARELLYQCAESLGAARRAEGRYPEAVAVYRRAFVQAADSVTAGSLAARLFLCHEATSSWREAADVLHRLVLDYPNASIRLDANHQANAAWFARLKLATLPAEGRRHFSERHDAPARDLLQRAEQSGDPSLLEGVLIYRLSSVARRAAVALAHIHRDAGRLDECERLLEHALLSLPRGDEPATAVSNAQLLAELCALSLVREQVDRTAFYLQRLERELPDASVNVRLSDVPAAPARSVSAVSQRIRQLLKARHHNVDELLLAFINEAGRARRLPDDFEPPLTELWRRGVAGLDPRLEVHASRGEALARLSDGSLARLASHSGSPLGVIELAGAAATPGSEIVVWPAADLLVRGGETLTAHAMADGARRFSFEAGRQPTTAPGGSPVQPSTRSVARRKSRPNLDAAIQQILAQITARMSASSAQSRVVTTLRKQLRQLLLLRAQVGRMATTTGFRSLLPVGLRLIFTGDHGQVWAIDPRGKLLWQTTTEDRLPSSIDKPTRVLYCEAAASLILVRGNSVTALAPQDGSIRWRFAPGDTLTATPRGRSGLAAIFGPQDIIDVALDGSLLYLVRANGTITCLDVSSAEQLAETRLEQDPGSLILSAGYLVSASVLSQTLTALDAKTLEPRWERPLNGEDLVTWPVTELAVSGTTLYLTGMWLRAFDLRTGRQLWEDTERRQMVMARKRAATEQGNGGDARPVPTFILGRPAFVAGRLIVACGDGTVLAYNRFEIELRNSLALVRDDADDAAAQLRLARLYHQAGKRESEVTALRSCMAAAARRQAPGDARLAKTAAEQLVAARISAAVELLPQEPEQARAELGLAVTEGGAAAQARQALISLLTALAWEHQGHPEAAVNELVGMLTRQPAGGAELVQLSAVRTLSVVSLARERLSGQLQQLQSSDLHVYRQLLDKLQEQVAAAAGETNRQRLATLGMIWATTAPGQQALLEAARLASEAGDRWQERELLGTLTWSPNVSPQLRGEALLALARHEPPMQARARLVDLATSGPPRLAERARAGIQRANSELTQTRLESSDLALVFKHRVISNSRTAIVFPEPVLRDGILYTAAEAASGATLVALDTRQRGQPLFAATEPALDGFLDRPPLPPAIALAGASVVTAGHAVTARDAITGALRWRYTGPGFGATSLVDASVPSGAAEDPAEQPARPLPGPRRVVGVGLSSVTLSGGKITRHRGVVFGAVVPVLATGPVTRGFTLAVDPDAPQRVVVLETSGELTALASDDGQVLWRRAASTETVEISSRGPRGPNQPVVRGGYGPGSPALRAWGGRIVICDGRSALVLDAASGRRLLRIALANLNSQAPAADRKSFGGALASSVTVRAEALHVTDMGGKVGVWSLRTGNLLWSSFSLSDQGGEGQVALAPGPSQSYVAVLWGKHLTTTDSALHLMRSHRWQAGRQRWDGRKAWYYDHQEVAGDAGTGATGDADARQEQAPSSGRVMVSQASLPPKPTGPIAFAAPPQGRGPLHAAMTIHGDQVFVAQETLLVFDLESGRLLAQLPLAGGQADALKAGAPPYPQGFLPPPPLVSGGFIYVVRPDGQLHVYSGSGGD